MIGQQLSELLHCWSTAHQKNITSYSRRNQEDWIEISLHCHDCSTYHKHTTWLDNISPTYHMIGRHFTNIQHDWSTYHKHTTWLVNISQTYHVIGQHITNIPRDWSTYHKHTTWLVDTNQYHPGGVGGPWRSSVCGVSRPDAAFNHTNGPRVMGGS